MNGTADDAMFQILNHISLLDSDSEVEVYLSKVLKDLDRDGRSSVISTVGRISLFVYLLQHVL